MLSAQMKWLTKVWSILKPQVRKDSSVGPIASSSSTVHSKGVAFPPCFPPRRWRASPVAPAMLISSRTSVMPRSNANRTCGESPFCSRAFASLQCTIWSKALCTSKLATRMGRPHSWARCNRMRKLSLA
eukprot:8890228-Lingulodinium_polyedra.AAC.1